MTSACKLSECFPQEMRNRMNPSLREGHHQPRSVWATPLENPHHKAQTSLGVRNGENTLPQASSSPMGSARKARASLVWDQTSVGSLWSYRTSGKMTFSICMWNTHTISPTAATTQGRLWLQRDRLLTLLSPCLLYPCHSIWPLQKIVWRAVQPSCKELDL